MSQAYVTLLTRDSYLPGVLALARSLAHVGAAHPLLVVHTGGLSKASLAALWREGCSQREVEPLQPAGADAAGYKQPWYADCWSKLRLWELGGYTRLVYLDADMIVCQNIDHLFQLPEGLHAAPDCSMGRASQQERAACQFFAMEQGGEAAYFNAGLLVLAPSPATFAAFMGMLARHEVQIGQFAEQDFLNAVYRRSCTLPWTYNGQKCIKHHHPRLWDLSRVHVLHFVDAKPWQAPLEAACHDPWRQEVQLWYDMMHRRRSSPVVAELDDSGPIAPPTP